MVCGLDGALDLSRRLGVSIYVYMHTYPTPHVRAPVYIVI